MVTKAEAVAAMGVRQSGHLPAAARGRISLQFVHMLRFSISVKSLTPEERLMQVDAGRARRLNVSLGVAAS